MTANGWIVYCGKCGYAFAWEFRLWPNGRWNFLQIEKYTIVCQYDGNPISTKWEMDHDTKRNTTHYHRINLKSWTAKSRQKKRKKTDNKLNCDGINMMEIDWWYIVINHCSVFSCTHSMHLVFFFCFSLVCTVCIVYTVCTTITKYPISILVKIWLKSFHLFIYRMPTEYILTLRKTFFVLMLITTSIHPSLKFS